MKIEVRHDVFTLAQTFAISRGSTNESNVATVRITRAGHTGWGEGVPSKRYNQSVDLVKEQIAALPETFDRADLYDLLPAGAARNALDCALWDLEAKEAGKRMWEIAGLETPKPVVCAYTLSLDTPEVMFDEAAKNAHRPLLKIKLGAAQDLERLEAVRRAAPNVRIVIDANEGWSASDYEQIQPDLVRLGVVMVEQPLRAGDDDALADMERLIPVCADESCIDRSSLSDLVGKYDVINIKLDKTGGLTEALALRDAAKELGFEIMVGCMVGTSLAMAPGTLIAQGAFVTDLDGPLLLAHDRDTALNYDNGLIHPPTPELWG